MSLTPFGIKNASRKDKAYKLSDGGGLYLSYGGKWVTV